MLDMRRGEEALARQTLENLGHGRSKPNISRKYRDLRPVPEGGSPTNMLLPEIASVLEAGSSPHPVRSMRPRPRHFGAIQVFDADGQADHRCLHARSPAGQPRRTRTISGFIVTNPGIGLFISRPMLFHGRPIRSC